MSSGSRGRRGSSAAHAAQIESSNTGRVQLSLKEYFCRRQAPSPLEASKGPLVNPLKGCPVATAKDSPGGPSGGPPSCCVKSELGAPCAPASMIIDLTEVKEVCACSVEASQQGGPSPGAEGVAVKGLLKGVPLKTERGPPAGPLKTRTRVLPWERPPMTAASSGYTYPGRKSSGARVGAAAAPAAADPVAAACAAAGLPVAEIETRALPTLRLLLPLRLSIAAAATYLQHLLLPEEYECIQTLGRLLGMPAGVVLSATRRGAAAAEATGKSGLPETAASAAAAVAQATVASEATAAAASALATSTSTATTTAAAAASATSAAATATAAILSSHSRALSAAAVEVVQSTSASHLSTGATCAPAPAEAGTTETVAREGVASAAAAMSLQATASARLTVLTPEQDSAVTAAAISAATIDSIPRAATTPAAADLTSLRETAAEGAGGAAASAKVGEPLSEGAQLLFARLVVHLLRLSLTRTGPPAARRCASRSGSSNSSSNNSSSSWIRLPPLLRVSRELPSAAAALRELLVRGLLFLWTPQTSPVPLSSSTAAAPARPSAPTAAECGRCAAAVDGLCACSWSSALLCLSHSELRDVLSGALTALGTQREAWGPPAKLTTRGEIVSFLQQLAAGHKPANSGNSSSSSRRLEEFFGAAVICQSKTPRNVPGDPILPAVVRDAIRSIRTRVVGICRCLAQLKQQQLLLQSLRVAFLATHAPHAAAVGSLAATAPGYVVTAAGQLLQQVQQQQMQRQQQNEEDLFAIACAAMLPAVQRVSHLVDLRLRQLQPHLLLQQQHQQPSQQQEKQQPEQCSVAAHLFNKKQQEASAQTSNAPHDLKQHSQGPFMSDNGSGGRGSTSSAERNSSSISLEELLACLSPKNSTLSSAEGDSATAGPPDAAAGAEAQAAAFAVARTGAAPATEAPRLLPIWICSCCSCTKQRTTAAAPAASSRRQLSLFAAALLAEFRMSFVAPEAARGTRGSAASAAAAAGTSGAASTSETEALQLACDAERELLIHIRERQEANAQQPTTTSVAPCGSPCSDTAAQSSSPKVVPGAAAERKAPAAAPADSTEVHLLRFSAPYAWASVVWQSVQLLEQRRQHAAAVQRLLLLLQLHELYSIPSAALEPPIRGADRAENNFQEHYQQPQKTGVYSHRIGRWFSRLTVLLQKHLHQPQRAIVEGVRFLRDAGAVRKAERQEITRRVIKAAASLQRKGVAFTWEQLQEQALQQQQQREHLQQQQQLLLTTDSSDPDASVSNFRRKVRSRSNEADERSSSYSSSTSSSRTSSDSERSSSSGQQLPPSRRSRKRPLPPRASLRKRRRIAGTPNSSPGSSSSSLQRGKQQQGQQQPAFLQLLPVDVHNTVLQECAEHALLQEQLPLCVVPARPLAATAAAGRSSVFIGWDGLLLRVEQLALQHYCMQGGWQGVHDEGTCLRSIFLILTAAQQQQQQEEAGHGVGRLQQHLKHTECLDAAAADVAEGEVAYSVAFLPSINPMEESLLLPEQQQQQALLLQQLQRSTRREVYNLVKRSVAAVYGQQIRGVCWDWRSLDGAHFNADEEEQQQHQHQQQLQEQQVRSDQRAAEKDQDGGTESDKDILPPSESLVKPSQSVLQQDATAATACGVFYGRIAAAIGGPALASTFSLFLEDFRSWAPGLPDLILWRSRQIKLQSQQSETEHQGQEEPPQQQLHPERQHQKEQHQRQRQQQQQHGDVGEDANNFAEWEVMFAEVKGPRDSLSDKQKCWLHRFLAAGIPSQVCRVAEPQVAERMQEKQQEKNNERVEAALSTQAGRQRHASTRGSTARKKAKARQRAEKSCKKRKNVCDEPDATAISRVSRTNWRR